MALLDSKQLNPRLTGSFILSGSTQTFEGRSEFLGHITASGNISASGTIYADNFQSVGGDVGGISFADDLNITGDITASGAISASGDLSITGDVDFDGALDVDGTSNLDNTDIDGTLTVDGTNTTITSDTISLVGAITGSTHISASGNLSATGNFDIDGTSNLEGDVTLQNNLAVTGHITASGNISSSGTIYADNFTSTGGDSAGISFADDLNITGDITASGNISASGDLLGNNLDIAGTSKFSGSLEISGSTLTVNTLLTSSTAITTNNITNGYPTSNAWGTSLDGSYFNNFDNTTNVSEILRFMSGVISHSLDVADASPNTLTFHSIDTNENSLGTTDSLGGYLPTNYTALNNDTLNYLVHKDWTGVGETIFSGISVYHDNGSTYKIDFDSNSTGSTNISSSADSELFGLGGLTSGAATEFKVRAIATQSFSDTGSIANPSSSNTYTSQSYLDLSISSFGTSDGLTLAKIDTSQPAVIPAAYQDGKFADVGGTTMTGSLTRKYHTTETSFTSVSSSGYYNFHGLQVGIITGSESDYTFKTGSDTNNFWAPIDQIDSDIGTNTLADVGTTHRALTATSRSLSGAPYLIDATYEVSTKITGLFNPMYAASTTLVNMTAASVGAGSVSISGDTVSTNGGTVQTSGKVFQSDGTTAVDSGVPRYDDLVLITGSVSFDSGNSENINQTGVGDTTFTVATKARNKNSSNSTLDTQTITYHTAGDFDKPAASGSLGIYGRVQSYDGGELDGTTEVFTGEDFRIQLLDNVQAFNGTAWTTTYVLNQLGIYDLQVKPGYLVDPGGDYRYWYPEDFGAAGTYKYYIRRFQDGSTRTSMTIDVGATLVNWNTTTNGVAVALLFESSGNGSGNNSSLGVARIYDPSELTSNLIEADMANDNYKNPFSTAISLYGNTGGSKSSTEYTLPIRNADGMYLDSNDNELYVIVRYKGDATPVTTITLGFS